MTVLARVLSHYRSRGRILIDAGAIALSKDTCRDGDYGVVVPFPRSHGNSKTNTAYRLVKISQEHGIIEAGDGDGDGDGDGGMFTNLPIGSLVEILPNHSCLTAAAHDYISVFRQQNPRKIVETWKPCRGW